MSGDLLGLGDAQTSFRRSAQAAASLTSIGLTVETAARIGFGLDEAERGLVVLYPRLAADGIASIGRLIVAENMKSVAEVRGDPSPAWSAPPYDRATLVVAPDPIVMWLLQQALPRAAADQFLIVTRSHRNGLPMGWRDEDSWSRFETVTVLMDDAAAGDDLLNAFSVMSRVNVTAALPLAGFASWAQYLPTVKDPSEGGALIRMIETAIPLRRLLPAGSEGISRSDVVASSIHDLDALGRLRRVIMVEEHHSDQAGRRTGAKHGALIVRSDRRILTVVLPKAPAGTRARDRLFALSDGDRLLNGSDLAGACCGWPMAAAIAYATGRSAAEDEDSLRADLVSLLRSVGLTRSMASKVGAFVMLTYVYPAIRQLPLLAVEMSDPMMRQRFARLATALCYGGRQMGRARARTLARLADVTGGTIVMTDVGPMVGPCGPTETGRFVLSSLAPGSSTEHECGDEGLRTLRTFGPRIVVNATDPAIGLSDVMRIKVAEMSNANVDGRAGALTARLLCWSMNAIADVRRRSATVDDGMSALGIFIREEADEHEATEELDDTVNPETVLSDALSEVRRRTGDLMTLVQLTMEAALLGGEGETYSPERIGRWLANSGELEPGSATDRRRLFGRITRIYRLRGAAGSRGEVRASPFAFCEESLCTSCRYEAPCGRLFPELRANRSDVQPS